MKEREMAEVDFEESRSPERAETTGTTVAGASVEMRELLRNASLTEQFVLDHPELVRLNAQLRGLGKPVDIDELARQIREKRRMSRELDDYRHEINVIAKKGRDVTPEERERARTLKPVVRELETKLSAIQEEVKTNFSWLPNLTAPEVPLGDESANRILRQVGTPRRFDFQPESHVQLGVRLDLLNFAGAARVVGKGFYYLKNELVLIRQALTMMTTRHLVEQGFTPVVSPLVARERTLFGTGYFPFSEGDSFAINRLEGASLIGTSEQTLVAQHMDEVLEEAQLPLRYLCDSPCFRTEGGNYGKMTQGMLRVHQFHKLEQIIFCRPEESEQWQQVALDNEEWLLQQLEIPYQVVLISAQDMGAPGYKKFDLEGWIPTQEKYVELTSNTNLTDFQTRRLNIRARDRETGKFFFPHTISATAFSDRLLIAIVETYQQQNGTILIPEKLQPFLGGLTEIARA